MLRRTKIIVAAYCLGGLVFLAMAVGLVLQYTDWLGRPERYTEFTHHHHHEAEEAGPETSPATTYREGGRLYMEVPLQDEDFDVTQSSINLGDLLAVANLDPTKFPDLKSLTFVSAKECTLPDGDTVLGVSINGEEKAYPIRMLNYHVVLSDTCGGRKVAIVYDPLTMTPKVLDAVTEEGVVLTFGKLSLIYNGGLVLYDEPTRSLWWPPEARCLAGPLSETVLRGYRFLFVSWKTWRSLHPGTVVLSTKTEYASLYGSDWYGNYYSMTQLPVPVRGWNRETSPFAWSTAVLALERNGKAKAYPLLVTNEIHGLIEDSFGGKRVILQDPASLPRYPTDPEGGEIDYSFGAWFLWSVRYPDIEIYSRPDRSE